MSGNPYNNPFQTPSPAAKKQGGSTDMLIDALVKTRPWVRFFSVLSFIGGGLVALGALVVFLFGTVGVLVGGGGAGAGPGAVAAGGVMVIVISLVYFLLALLYLVPAWHLWKYAEAITSFSSQRSSGKLLEALQAQQKFWRFVGIVVLAYFVILVGFFGLMFLIGVASAAF